MQSINQGITVIHRGFTSRNHNNLCRRGFYPIANLRNRMHRKTFRWPAFFYITPNTTDIATCQTHKVRRLARMNTFALDGVKMFHHRKLHHANLALYTSNVFIIRPVIVIGPTPFGTGVMALTLSNTAS